jgi:hypothetical protein
MSSCYSGLDADNFGAPTGLLRGADECHLSGSLLSARIRVFKHLELI